MLLACLVRQDDRICLDLANGVRSDAIAESHHAAIDEREPSSTRKKNAGDTMERRSAWDLGLRISDGANPESLLPKT
jgi:hypothetical protein